MIICRMGTSHVSHNDNKETRPSEQPTFVDRAFCGIKFGQISEIIIQIQYTE